MESFTTWAALALASFTITVTILVSFSNTRRKRRQLKLIAKLFTMLTVLFISFGFFSLLISRNEGNQLEFIKQERDNQTGQLNIKDIPNIVETMEDKQSDPQYFFLAAKMYLKNKDYRNALIFLNKAIDIEPEDATFYNSRGFTYECIQDYNNAIADYTKALTLKPDYAVAYNNRGHAYNEMNLYDNAIKDFKQAIETDSKIAAPHKNIGLLYYNHKDYMKSLYELNEAIKIDPKYKEAYEIRAKVYFALEYYEEAKADEELIKELDTNDPIWNLVGD